MIISHKSRSFKIRWFLAFISLMLVSGCNFSLAADVTPPPGYQMESVADIETSTPVVAAFPLLPPDPVSGKQIFSDQCADCHGARGLGDGPRSQNLSNTSTPIGSIELARSAKPGDWFKIVSLGNLERNMPPFPGLTNRQRWDVVAYALSLSTSEQLLEEGKAIYIRQCSACHGIDGKGKGELAADIQPRDLTQLDFQVGNSIQDFYYVIQSGELPDMPSFLDILSEDEIWAAANYIRWLGYEQPDYQPDQSIVSSIPAYPVENGFDPAPVVGSGDQKLISISGSVTNKTGGSIPPDLQVVLYAFDQMHIVNTTTVEIELDGTYTFLNQVVETDQNIVATIDYLGITYSSDVIAGVTAQDHIDLPIEIFETDAQSSGLMVDRLHYFFERLDAATIRVVELYVISNQSLYTKIAQMEGGAVITFNIPKNAKNLVIQEGEIGKRFIETDNGFGDTFPIKPGEELYQVLYSYTLPFQKKIELSNKISLDTNALVILVPQDLIEVNGNNLQDSGIRDVQGASYHLYTGGSYQKGEKINLSITANMSSLIDSRPNGSSQNMLIGLTALGIVLITVGYWVYKQSLLVRPPKEEKKSEETSTDTVESLLDAILALDDLYQAGKLPDNVYIERRGELKALLKQQIEEHHQ